MKKPEIQAILCNVPYYNIPAPRRFNSRVEVIGEIEKIIMMLRSSANNLEQILKIIRDADCDLEEVKGGWFGFLGSTLYCKEILAKAIANKGLGLIISTKSFCY